ncbi:SsrA-binding protein SmpB [Dasania sp. GY-MA-18]|uniref:SsrA-binding protein n=1 Tax=Dasania phycosphaerae TaxID=2950436 RepID=A0A9J6RH92_9GAMM|nr:MULTISPECIES: SsrA-binding protein SmpB [Dasania]MCR8921269.1 SsrA-binding protein SmpB [Dasania sp. GY-MA-18]MCZ0863697.1 SsrA-binding protein SmpB [Dasania phycosphaerae]MCZ0867425.1 SsrA-binding protein SmpB [Dasania phycosphaerae]
MNKKKPKHTSNTIALNKKAKHDYHLETKFEAGISLLGWEVKSLREGKVQIVDTYVHMQNGEALLIGANITPLNTVSTHFVAEPTRTRKLLLNKRELAKLAEATQQDGRTCVCTALYWKNHLVKAEICIAKGKQKHDKRATEKDRDWGREKQRIVRDNTRQ